MTVGPSFVDFYRQHDISPVHQDISDLERHRRRRDSLYRHLGLPPAFLAGRSIAEFGPGSGHNAVATAALGPAHYVLIDGNPRGVAETRELLSRHGAPDEVCQVVASDFETFDTDERFDLVLAEGCLPYQPAAESLLRHIAQFTKPHGVLVITTVTPVSILSEIVRRLMRDLVVAPDAPPSEQLAILRPMLGSHLAALPGVTRSVDDWLLDNIVRPLWNTQTLSIPQVIAALGDEFDVYGASPAFLTDFRWYKQVHGADRGFNANALKRYFTITANLLDTRVELPPHRAEFGRWLEVACMQLWDLMRGVEGEGRGAPADAAPILEEIASVLHSISPNTADSIRQGREVLLGRMRPDACPAFASFWGRGQQYLSLIRR